MFGCWEWIHPLREGVRGHAFTREEALDYVRRARAGEDVQPHFIRPFSRPANPL